MYGDGRKKGLGERRRRREKKDEKGEEEEEEKEKEVGTRGIKRSRKGFAGRKRKVERGSKAPISEVVTVDKAT